jgi:lysozyme
MNDELLEELKRDEGLRLKPYHCSAGKLSIGYGRNLEDVGVTVGEAEAMLRTDILRAEAELDRAYPWWRRMSAPRQRAIANMCFNMGLARLAGFKKMLAALECGDYAAAAVEAKDSQWYRQVGDRADRIVKLIAEG